MSFAVLFEGFADYILEGAFFLSLAKKLFLIVSLWLLFGAVESTFANMAELYPQILAGLLV